MVPENNVDAIKQNGDMLIKTKPHISTLKLSGNIKKKLRVLY